jgi:GNAT superfamily N-acetyltransferase
MSTQRRQREGPTSRIRLAPVDDLNVLTRLANALYPEVPRTASDWDRTVRDFGGDLRLTIAWVDESPLGYSQSILDRANDVLNLEIAVLVADDATEVAAALHAAAAKRQQAESLSRLRASVLGHGAMAQYWTGAGLEIVERFHRLALRLPVRVPPMSTQIQVEELTSSNSILNAAHALYRDGVLDQPGGGDPDDLASWIQRLGDGTRRLVGTMDGAVVGYASLRTTEARPTTAFHTLTTVAREHRGRGIGQALKAGVIEWAQDHGFTELETASATENIRMRAINEALGFQPLPAVLVFE